MRRPTEGREPLALPANTPHVVRIRGKSTSLPRVVKFPPRRRSSSWDTMLAPGDTECILQNAKHVPGILLAPRHLSRPATAWASALGYCRPGITRNSGNLWHPSNSNKIEGPQPSAFTFWFSETFSEFTI